MMSLPKQWENADLGGTKQNIHRSKGFHESYSKMYPLLNLSHFLKSYGHLCQIYHDHSPNMVMSRDPGLIKLFGFSFPFHETPGL